MIDGGTSKFEWAIPRIATFAFNYLQLGLVVLAVQTVSTNPSNVLLLLSFELGILVDCVLRFGRIAFWIKVALISAIALAALLYFQKQDFASTICTFISVFLLSTSLKKIRTATDALGNIKKYWRAAGYLAAGFFIPWLLVTCVVTLSACIFNSSIKNNPDRVLATSVFFDRKHSIEYMMVLFHHLHYFSYAYVVIDVLVGKYNVSPAHLGPLFYIGWIGYYIFERKSLDQAKYVSGGHFLSSVAVLGMNATNSISLFLVLWFLTGVGGGTISLVRNANGEPEVYDRFKFWESIGHLFGLAVVSWSLIEAVPTVAFNVAATSGVICSIAALATAQNQNRKKK